MIALKKKQKKPLLYNQECSVYFHTVYCFTSLSAQSIFQVFALDSGGSVVKM